MRHGHAFPSIGTTVGAVDSTSASTCGSDIGDSGISECCSGLEDGLDVSRVLDDAHSRGGLGSPRRKVECRKRQSDKRRWKGK